MSEEIKGSGKEPTRVLVVGATGYIGRHVVAHLQELGYAVRALARSARQLEAERQKGVEVFVGQVTHPETLHGLCDGISVVVSALGVRSLKRKPTPWEVDYQGNLNVLANAQAAGVKHFIFVGVLHGEKLRTTVPILEPRELFIDKLCQSDLTWTILRPSGVFNDMQAFFQMAHKGRAYLVGTGEARINPIHPTDLAREVVRYIENTNTHNRTFEIGGPDIFTYTQIAQMAFQTQEKRPRIGHIAPWLVDGAAWIFAPFNANAAGFLRFFRQVSTIDMVGNETGQIHLSDFFTQLAHQRR